VLGYFNVNGTFPSQTPGVPVLAAASDTGKLSNDGLTRYTTPPVSRSRSPSSNTVVGATIRIFITGVELGSVVATGTTTTVPLNNGVVLNAGTKTVFAQQAEPGHPVSASGNTSITVDLTVPATPGTISVTSASASSISLDWPNNGDADVWGYDLYRATSPGGPYTKLNGAVLTTSQYVDNSVTTGQTYYYRVRCLDNAGNESGDSATASATAMDPSATPGTPDLLATSDTGVSAIDNITRYNNSAGEPLEFSIANTVAGATIALLIDNVEVASVVASGSTTTIAPGGTVTAGAKTIAVRQTEPGKLPATSGNLAMSIDRTAPLADDVVANPVAGQQFWNFAVDYSDVGAGVDVTTFGNDDVLVHRAGRLQPGRRLRQRRRLDRVLSRERAQRRLDGSRQWNLHDHPGGRRGKRHRRQTPAPRAASAPSTPTSTSRIVAGTSLHADFTAVGNLVTVERQRRQRRPHAGILDAVVRPGELRRARRPRHDRQRHAHPRSRAGQAGHLPRRRGQRSAQRERRQRHLRARCDDRLRRAGR
jgi:hypothetical protein